MGKSQQLASSASPAMAGCVASGSSLNLSDPLTLALASSQCRWQVRRKQGCENAILKSEKHCYRHMSSPTGGAVPGQSSQCETPYAGGAKTLGGGPGAGDACGAAQPDAVFHSQAGSQLRQMRSVMPAGCCPAPGSVPVLPH